MKVAFDLLVDLDTADKYKLEERTPVLKFQLYLNSFLLSFDAKYFVTFSTYEEYVTLYLYYK